MAILDAGLEFSDAQAVTASAASTNVIDLGVASPNRGRADEPLYLQVKCNTTTASAGSSTLDIALQDCDTEGGTYVDVVASKQWAKADVVAGADLFTVALPPTHRRYLRVNYTVGTANFSAGAFDAYLTTGPN